MPAPSAHLVSVAAVSSFAGRRPIVRPPRTDRDRPARRGLAAGGLPPPRALQSSLQRTAQRSGSLARPGCRSPCSPALGAFRLVHVHRRRVTHSATMRRGGGGGAPQPSNTFAWATGGSTPPPSNSTPPRNTPRGACFTCGQTGHQQRDCPQNRAAQRPGAAPAGLRETVAEDLANEARAQSSSLPARPN